MRLPIPLPITGQNSYFVQVAAVSKQEDAAALVDALKKKQYAAFAASARWRQAVPCAGGTFFRHQGRGKRARAAGEGWVQSDTEEVIGGRQTSDF